jgi:hypothetical protein
MRATLLLATLLFGAPVLPDDQQQDPASEANTSGPGLAEIVDRLLELSEPLLRCASREEFFAALDLAVLRLDFTELALAGGEARHFAPGDADEQLRVAAVRQVEAIVSPTWRAELRAGLAEARAAHAYAEHPAIVHGYASLTDESIPTIHQIIGDPTRPLTLRRALLQYVRGLLCAGALAATAVEGEALPDWLAELLIPQWRDTLQQLESFVQTGALREFAADARLEPSPAADLMLRFQCRDGEQVAGCLQADPPLAALLVELHTRALRYFPTDAIHAFTLGSSWAGDEAEEPALIVAIHTSQDLAEAEAALARLDHEWWLERSLQSTTRVVVDIRFT